MQSYKEFRQKLNEETPDIGEMVNKIVSDCQPFLKEIDGEVDEYRLYRGIKSKEDFMKKKIRTDRKPSATKSIIHNMIDDYFEENFGIRFRSNSMFVNGDETATYTYGRTYIVFPIDKFKFLWTDLVFDLFISLPGQLKDIEDDEETKKDLEKLGIEPNDEDIRKQLRLWLDRREYQMDDLKKAIKSGNEIMIAGSGYYAIEKDFFDEMNLGEEIQDAYEMGF